MKKGIPIILAILLSVCQLIAQQYNPSDNRSSSKSFTLEECLRYAEEHNFALQNAGLNVTSSEISLRQAKENIAPSVSASASQGFNANNYQKSIGWNGSYGINAGMTLFSGLYNYNNIKKSQLQVEQSDLELQQSRDKVRVSIIQAFLAIMMNQDLLDYQQAQYTSDLYNIENTKINIQNNYLALKNLLSIAPGEELAIVRPDSATLFRNLEVPSLPELMEKSRAYLPQLKISENDIASAEYDVKLQKSNFYPSLSLSTGISTGYSGNNQSDNLGWGTQLWHGLGENVGLNLSIPIYQRSQVRNSVKQAQLRVQQAELTKQEVSYQIDQELQQYYLDILSAQNDYRVAEARKEAYEANYNAYSFKFKYGSITAVDLIQQQTNYINQLNQYMQSKYSFVLQRKILDVLMGVPVRL